jgi:hypothetical protein
MKRIKQMMLLAGVAGLLSFGAGKVVAQGRGNFDPEQFRQRMMDNYKEQLEVKSDDEWKIISARIEKVMTAQRDARVGRSGFGGGGQRRNRGGDNAAADTNTQRNRSPFGGEPNPDVEALQKAIDAKASNEEIKGKLAKARQSIKEKEAALTAAQDDLRKVLSVRQEAIALTIGLLK